MAEVVWTIAVGAFLRFVMFLSLVFVVSAVHGLVNSNSVLLTVRLLFGCTWMIWFPSRARDQSASLHLVFSASLQLFLSSIAPLPSEEIFKKILQHAKVFVKLRIIGWEFNIRLIFCVAAGGNNAICGPQESVPKGSLISYTGCFIHHSQNTAESYTRPWTVIWIVNPRPPPPPPHLLSNKTRDPRGRGRGTPIYGLYGDVLLNRVWFLPLSLEQGLEIGDSVWKRV